MKRICYIELDTHAEIAANFIELLQDSGEFSVDYYFSEKIYKNVGKNWSNIFLIDSSKIVNLLKKRKYDLVIFGTAHRYFNVFKEICENFNSAVVVHNINFTSISPLKLLTSIFKKDIQYRLKLFFKEGLQSAPQVFRTAKHLLVLDESLAKGNVRFLPVFFSNFNEKAVSEVFTIVVPGAVSQQRRNYKMIINELNSYGEKFDKKFQVIFLGKAKGEELQWLKDFEKSKPDNISIKYFTEKVPQTEFDQWMKQADVLWCPVQKNTEFFSQQEIYGETKMSGNIGDAIKYTKTAFFPENFKTNYGFIRNSNSILEILKENNSDFNFQKNYSRKQVLQELEDVLKTLM